MALHYVLVGQPVITSAGDAATRSFSVSGAAAATTAASTMPVHNTPFEGWFCKTKKEKEREKWLIVKLIENEIHAHFEWQHERASHE
jgi:hypothetical protein